MRCTFTQRLQRPRFVRQTKHAKRGEEDVGYSYVVVRRGERNRDLGGGEGGVAVVREGRIGAVGRWAEEAEKAREDRQDEERAGKGRWSVDEDGVEAGVVVEESEAVRVEASEESIPVDGLQDESGEEVGMGAKELEEVLRNEAYGWPRINFPPLKRSGHVLIDACMPEGMPCTQAFVDALTLIHVLFRREHYANDFSPVAG